MSQAPHTKSGISKIGIKTQPRPLSKRIISWSIKIGIISLALWHIYSEIMAESTAALTALYNGLFTAKAAIYGSIAAALVAVNWGIESAKWQFLASKVERISFRKAVSGVLAGITTSIFTPNRTGEFAGRIFLLEQGNRVEGALVSMIGSFSQWLATMIFGVICTPIYLMVYQYSEIPTTWIWLILSLSGILCVLLTLMYFNMHLVAGFFKDTASKWGMKVAKYSRAFSYFNVKDLSRILSMSLVRYLTFVAQFYCLASLFGMDINLLTTLLCMGTMFMAATVIPTIAVTEVGVREVVALHVFGAVIPGVTASVVASSFALWMINLALPSLVGSIHILRLRFFRG